MNLLWAAHVCLGTISFPLDVSASLRAPVLSPVIHSRTRQLTKLTLFLLFGETSGGIHASLSLCIGQSLPSPSHTSITPAGTCLAFSLPLLLPAGSLRPGSTTVLEQGTIRVAELLGSHCIRIWIATSPNLRVPRSRLERSLLRHGSHSQLHVRCGRRSPEHWKLYSKVRLTSARRGRGKCVSIY